MLFGHNFIALKITDGKRDEDRETEKSIFIKTLLFFSSKTDLGSDTRS